MIHLNVHISLALLCKDRAEPLEIRYIPCRKFRADLQILETKTFF